jgi:hypothetical protein
MLECLFSTLLLATSTVFVSPQGIDSAERDGLSKATAFASLPYACERLKPGRNTIRVSAGVYQCDRAAVVPSDTEILGAGFHGKQFSELSASPRWKLSAEAAEETLDKESLIVIRRDAQNVKIYGLLLRSSGEHPISGGVTMTHAEKIKVDTCRFRDFRWFGIRALNCKEIEIAGCSFRHCSQQKFKHRSGQILTRWLSDSTIHHCRFEPMPSGGGYGYKGGGHTNVRLHDNRFLPSYFSIESPHESEFGLEIDHNELNGAISVPKGGQGADPGKRGHEYSVRIHHNLMTDSYAIEGPRNHLRVDHNHIRISKVGGRVYSQFGGTNHGPVTFDHNVIENVDRSILWIRQGLAEKVLFEANTVFVADAPGRAGPLFSAYSGENINQWTIRDNVIVASWNQPRQLLNTQRGVPKKMSIQNNLLVNVTDAPEGNEVGTWPGFQRGDAAKPWGYFSSVSARGPTVDRGIRDEDDFGGEGPDIGAAEYGVQFDVVGPRR